MNDKIMIFWTLLFPLMLALFFNAVLRDAYNVEKFEAAPIGILETTSYQEDIQFQEIMKIMEEEYNLITIVSVSNQEDLELMLETDKIVAIVEKGDEIKLIVDDSSIEVTIVKAVMDAYLQQSSTIMNLIENRGDLPIEELLRNIDFSTSYFGPTADWNYNMYVVHFYTILAMVCLYGAHWGLKSTEYLQANLSSVGIRMNLAPISKKRLVLTDVCVVFICISLENLILFGFLKYILKVDFGQHNLLILATTVAGSLLSIALGYLAGVMIKAQGVRESVVTAITLILSFSSGMQVAKTKYFIEQYVPLFGYINPAMLITDSYYVTYYYTDVSRVYTNIGLLLVYTVIVAFIAYRKVRGLSYDSI